MTFLNELWDNEPAMREIFEVDDRYGLLRVRGASRPAAPVSSTVAVPVSPVVEQPA